MDQRLPTVAITSTKMTSHEISRQLAQAGIFTWAGNYYALPVTERLGLEPDGMVRIGLVHYNTADEVDYLLAHARAGVSVKLSYFGMPTISDLVPQIDSRLMGGIRFLDQAPLLSQCPVDDSGSSVSKRKLPHASHQRSPKLPLGLRFDFVLPVDWTLISSMQVRPSCSGAIAFPHRPAKSFEQAYRASQDSLRDRSTQSLL